MLVRPLRADEWPLLRELRLRALADAPEAFASTHAREAAAPERMWRERAAGGPEIVTLLATTGPEGDGAAPAGMTTVRLEGGRPPRGHLLGMWVDPAHRGQGVAGELIDAAANWARARGVTELVLWVVDGNTAALSAYRRAGFEPTGDHQPLPSRPEVSESMLRRAL
ncbi:MAG TPA: GNAT family N-acetyltransferase [Actinomycetes bacterium]